MTRPYDKRLLVFDLTKQLVCVAYMSQRRIYFWFERILLRTKNKTQVVTDVFIFSDYNCLYYAFLLAFLLYDLFIICVSLSPKYTCDHLALQHRVTAPPHNRNHVYAVTLNA